MTIPEPSAATEVDSRRLRRRTRLLALTLLTCALLFSLVVAEILLRALHPLVDPYWRFKIRPDRVNTYIPSQFAPNFRLQLETEDGLPGMVKHVTLSINNMGFRGDSLVMPKPPNEFRVFLIGGSTTESLYLDDSMAFPRVIQDSLQALFPKRDIKVYGAGKSGDKTYDHIAMIAHRITHLQPDLIIIFCGINDLLAAINGRDYLFFSRLSNTEDDNWDLSHLARFAVTEFQVGRLVVGALKRETYQEAVEAIRMESDIKSAVAIRRSLPVANEPPVTNLVAYRENLTSIIGLAKAHRMGVMFMTQATSWNSKVDSTNETWHWMNIGDGVAYPEARMEEAMQSYNDELRKVAGAMRIPVYDLASVLPKSLAYFYDDVHFNVRGAAVAGGLLAHFIAGSRMLPDSAESRSQAVPTDLTSR